LYRIFEQFWKIHLTNYITFDTYAPKYGNIINGSKTLEREDIRAQDIRAQKHIMSSILEYNKKKLLFKYIFNADSESGFGFTVEKIFRILYDYKIKKYFVTFFASQKFIQLFMKHVLVT